MDVQRRLFLNTDAPKWYRVASTIVRRYHTDTGRGSQGRQYRGKPLHVIPLATLHRAAALGQSPTRETVSRHAAVVVQRKQYNPSEALCRAHWGCGPPHVLHLWAKAGPRSRCPRMLRIHTRKRWVFSELSRRKRRSYQVTRELNVLNI